jgi:putative PEP-CTERM system TPR-repeat lipoprotein
MRKRLLIAVPPLTMAVLAGAWFLFGRTGDPVAAARLRIERRDMKGASLYLRDAIRAQPKNAEAAFLLGKVDLALGSPTAAQTEFLRARDHGYDKSALVLPLGQAYLQQHHYTELLQDFTPASAPEGTGADTLSLRAAAQMSLHDIDDAAASSASAENLAPHAPYVLLTAARLALVRGDTAGAETRLTQILGGTAKPDDTIREDALLLRGDIALRHNSIPEALTDARDVIAASPSRLDAKLLEARALAASGQDKAAHAEVDEVLHHAPKDITANYLRVVLAIRSADYAAADASLQQISPSLSDLPRGFYFLAVTKLGLGQLAQAEEAATQYLAQSPDDISGLKLMGFVDLAEHHPDRTLALLHDTALSTHQDADIYDLRGRAQAMSGDLASARENLTKAAALHPSDPSLLNRLGAVEMDLGDLQAGEAELKHSLALSPKQGQTGATIVEADLARGDLAAAHTDLDQMRVTLGDAETTGILDAQIKLASLDTDGAETELHQVKQRFPDSRAATLFLVRIASLRGDTAQVQTLLEAALKKHPADAGLLAALLPSLYAQNQTQTAIDLAQAARDAAPANPTLTALLADTYLHAKQPERAIGLLDRASAGTNPALDLMRARIQAQQGQTSQALATLQSILDRSPADIRACALKASLQVQTGDYDAARATLRDGLKHAPGNQALLDALVGIDLKQSGPKAALATAASLQSVPSNLPAANSLPGAIYLAAGNLKAASAAFLASYRATPSSDLAIKAATTASRSGDLAQGVTLLEAWTASHPADRTAQFVLSSFYLDRGQFAPAAEHLQSVLAADPTNGPALNNLAWIRQRQGNTTEAKSLAERAYFAAPGAETADTLGWILAQQGDTSAALPLLKQAATTADPSLHATATYHHAAAMAAAGQRDEARTELQTALASPASFHERDEASRLLATLK